MRGTSVGLCFAMLAGGPVGALSCMAPNAARTFNELAEAEATYYVGIGAFTAPSAVPELPKGQSGSARMYFEGELFSRLETVPYAGSVGVTVECAAVWCASFPERNQDLLVFLEAGADRSMTLTEGPCPFRVLPVPTQEQRGALFDCMKEHRCGPDQITAFERE